MPAQAFDVSCYMEVEKREMPFILLPIIGEERLIGRGFDEWLTSTDPGGRCVKCDACCENLLKMQAAKLRLSHYSVTLCMLEKGIGKRTNNDLILRI